MLRNVKWYLVRRWVYGVVIAAGALAVYYRLIQPEAVPLFAVLVLALLNTRPPAVPGETDDND